MKSLKHLMQILKVSLTWTDPRKFKKKLVR